ncbi:hypothetical protein SY88_22150 [Clostridiales bacterium PH28_bin88]|nr:hypothetical protein SY88_22150 [Clostridiales bacterium PH28_bin88]
MNNPPSRREERKLEHIKYSLEMMDGPVTSGFEDVELVHQALPELDLEGVEIGAQFLGKELRLPLVINALTGGTEKTTEINRSLARVARETGVGMAVGSQAAALENRGVEESFRVAREENPHGLLLANVGASTPWQSASRAVEMIEADGLQLHLNVPQELAMAEGDRSFRSILANIATIVQRVPVPVVVKEVGFGISREAIIGLFAAGVRYVDVGGQGGTNFVAIERARWPEEPGGPPSHWGIPTAVSLLEAAGTGLPLQLIASGGIRSPLDTAKAIALGAHLVGVAGPMLRVLITQSETVLTELIKRWQSELQTIMLMAGAGRVVDLARLPVVITGKTREWLSQRGIDTAKYARR